MAGRKFIPLFQIINRNIINMKKNIIALCLFLLFANLAYSQTPNELSAKEIKKGWVLLFDGTTTNGWTTTKKQPVPSGGWEIKDGSINTILGGKGADIITAEEYSDFDLSVDFKITRVVTAELSIFLQNMKPEEIWGGISDH